MKKSQKGGAAIAFMLIAAVAAATYIMQTTDLVRVSGKKTAAVRHGYLAESMSKGIFNYTVYAIKERWCMDKAWGRDVECGGGDMKEFVTHPRNLERLLWSKTASDGILDRYKNKYGSNPTSELPLRTFDYEVKIADLSELALTHPVNLTIPPQAKKCFDSFKIHIERPANSSNYAKGDEVPLYIKNTFVKSKDTSPLCADLNRREISTEGLVLFFPRTLNQFGLIKAGNMPIGDIASDQPGGGLHFWGDVYVQGDLQIPQKKVNVDFKGLVRMGEGQMTYKNKPIQVVHNGTTESMLNSHFDTFGGFLGGVGLDGEADEGLNYLFNDGYEYPPESSMAECLPRLKLKENPSETRLSRLYAKYVGSNTIQLGLSQKDEFRNYGVHGKDDTGYYIREIESNYPGVEELPAVEFPFRPKDEKPVMKVTVSYGSYNNKFAKTILMGRNTTVKVPLFNKEKLLVELKKDVDNAEHELQSRKEKIKENEEMIMQLRDELNGDIKNRTENLDKDWELRINDVYSEIDTTGKRYQLIKQFSQDSSMYGCHTPSRVERCYSEFLNFLETHGGATAVNNEVPDRSVAQVDPIEGTENQELQPITPDVEMKPVDPAEGAQPETQPDENLDLQLGGDDINNLAKMSEDEFRKLVRDMHLYNNYLDEKRDYEKKRQDLVSGANENNGGFFGNMGIKFKIKKLEDQNRQLQRNMHRYEEAHREAVQKYEDAKNRIVVPVLRLQTSSRYSDKVNLSYQMENQQALINDNPREFVDIRDLRIDFAAFDFAVETSTNDETGIRTDPYSHLPGPNDPHHKNSVRFITKVGRYSNQIDWSRTGLYTYNGDSLRDGSWKNLNSGDPRGYPYEYRMHNGRYQKFAISPFPDNQSLTVEAAKELDKNCGMDTSATTGIEWDVSFTKKTQFSWLYNVTAPGISIDNAQNVKPLESHTFSNADMLPGNYQGVPSLSIIVDCIVPPHVDTVFGFYVCQKLTVKERSTPLDFIGTLIVRDLDISPSALSKGVNFYSVWNEAAIEKLKRRGDLRRVNKPFGDQACVFDEPGWNPDLPEPVIEDFQTCSPMQFVYYGANNFNWTTVDPEIGIPDDTTQRFVSTVSKVPNRYRRYTATIVWMR